MLSDKKQNKARSRVNMLKHFYFFRLNGNAGVVVEAASITNNRSKSDTRSKSFRV